jgi:hypothetical protein
LKGKYDVANFDEEFTTEGLSPIYLYLSRTNIILLTVRFNFFEAI